MEKAGLKVLMISSDRQILSPESAVSKRMREYGELVGELHIVLLSDKRHGLREGKVSENVWVYPTSSVSKFLRPINAVRIGRKILCDLITTQDPFECGWVGARIKKAKNMPLEVQLHTDPFSPQFGGPLNLIRKIIMRSVLREADSIRVVLKSVGDKLREKYRVENVSVLPIYVDRGRIDGEPKFDLHKRFGWKHVILAVSRLSPEKNIGVAVDAVSKLPDAGLVIVGEGPERNKFKETDKVKFVGWQEDLASYYRTADVFVQTSKFEGYGLSLVEAGLSGLTVVSTPVGIAAELKNVQIAETRDEFISAIESVLESRPSGLKEELESKILSKEEYLNRLVNNWVDLTK